METVSKDWKKDNWTELLARKEEEGLELVEWKHTVHEDVHVIFHRPSDESYIVWTAYCNGQDHTTYSSFYNGAYDLDLHAARTELQRRMQR